jgi:hypothetical protein
MWPFSDATSDYWKNRALEAEHGKSAFWAAWLDSLKEIRVLNRAVFEKSKLKKLLRQERYVNKMLRLELVDRVKEMDSMKQVIIEMGQPDIKMPVKNDRAS